MATKKKTKRANASKLQLVHSRRELIAAPRGELAADLTSKAQRRCLKAAVDLTRANKKITKRDLSRAMGLSESGSQGHLRALVDNGCIRARTEMQEVVVGYELTDRGKATYNELVSLQRMPGSPD